MMALFGLLWLMRIRAEVRKDKRKRCNVRQHQEVDEQQQHQHPHLLLLPPPVSFADRNYSNHVVSVEADDNNSSLLDDVIPPPPPPPLRQNVQIHRSSSIRDNLDYPAGFVVRPAQSFSRSAQNLPLECTCPGAGRPIRRPAVRFCDDPFGFYSAGGNSPSGVGQSWNYSSVVSTLPRVRPTSRSAHG